MRAVRAHARGGAEQLRLEEVPKPEPRAGEALVRVHAAGITPTELVWPETWVDRQGHDRTPMIPSHEVSGVVEELGHGVTHVVAGEEVYGLVPFDNDGAAADYVAVRARDLAPKPVTLDHGRTAALPLSALTAWQAFTEQARVRPGQHVLVHGGAGGVGAFAVQIAKVLGARVTATASAGDIEYVRSLGADVVIDYKAAPFEEIVSDVDVVLDPIGGRTAEASLGVLNDGGSLISLAGPPTVTLPEGRNLSARFFIVEPERSQLIELARLVDDGRLRVDVAQVFPLEDFAAAYEYGRTARRRGKIVVQVTAAVPELIEQAVGATAG
ncbi:MAG TPA: NADP-dependent oxidoreductase [Candidatus Binatia bacterium]|nr:NADP-dependent oxidoreductase [Candidatus Binatia bacterium]